MGEYLPIILICLATSFISNIFFQKIFIQKNIIDNINDRSSHTVKATRSGGIAIFSSFYYIGFQLFLFS